ncbi:helix-turn-helix transcriptional regulator [Paraburkholderia sp. MM5477-R1]|uniref:helix-turn-helix transcriptional regulator n=1 Tax=Paraburkholderia sp. MM5477-R1 TaxID=2991062 RepID=UPI003D1CE010
MSSERLQALSHAQRDRLAYIEQKLWFVGDMRRQDLVDRFGVQTAAATRDLSLYRELAPGNLEYDSRGKLYVMGPEFEPMFHFSPERILTWLSEGFGDGEPINSRAGVDCEIPARLGQPALPILATITRAMKQHQVLRIKYHSLGTGRSEREIAPFALLDTGLRWHARAYDRKSGDFRDFVLTRIQDVTILHDTVIGPHEQPDQDIQWSRIVELELVPHPGQPHPKITEMDYGMRDGMLKVRLRAATAGYVLRKWGVDCSPDHSLHGPEYRLWLRDHLALYGVTNAVLAPGYTQQQPVSKLVGK